MKTYLCRRENTIICYTNVVVWARTFTYSTLKLKFSRNFFMFWTWNNDVIMHPYKKIINLAVIWTGNQVWWRNSFNLGLWVCICGNNDGRRIWLELCHLRSWFQAPFKMADLEFGHYFIRMPIPSGPVVRLENFRIILLYNTCMSMT